MVLCQMESVSGSDVVDVCVWVVQIEVLRLRQGRFEESLVAYPGLSSEKRHLLVVISQHLLLR